MSTSSALLKEASEKLYPLIIQSLSDQKSTRYNGKADWSFKQLDNWRNVELPQIVATRYKESGSTWLVKEELTLLMDWKLAKGKFRPTLPKLIRQNEPDVVKSVTKSGFSTILDFVGKLSEKSLLVGVEKEYISVVKEATKKVSELRGVGPATGSLILSLLVDILALAPPFLSDESFIYFVVEPSRSGTKIKYNIKEYVDEFLPVFLELATGHDESLVMLERGAWALKFYDTGKIDIAADISVPFDIKQELMFKYIPAVKQEKSNTKESKSRKSDNADMKTEPVKKRARK